MGTLAGVLTAFGAVPAHAHAAIDGGGPFINGLLHPAIEPAHALILIGIGLWLGRQTATGLRTGTVSFTILLAISLLLPALAIPTPILYGAALVAGLLAANALIVAPRLAAAITAIAALLIGINSASDDSMLSIGIWVGALLILLNVVNIAMRVRAPWMIIGTRVLGAWIVAIALMLLAFVLRSA
jgi:hypothetical protein